LLFECYSVMLLSQFVHARTFVTCTWVWLNTADQPQFTAEHSVRLTDNISIFAAELTANKLALLSVINTVKADICILSDSFSYLQAVSSGKSISRPNPLTEIFDLIRKCNRNINVIWLPSHIGIKGNELADRLANFAISGDNINIDIALKLSEACDLVNRSITGEMRPSGWHYRTIQRNVFTKIKLLHPSRHKDVVLTMLRLCKCCLNPYLHQTGKHPNELCNSCNKPETVT